MGAVVVPYIPTHLRPETVDSVRGCDLPHTFVELRQDQPQGYAELIIRLWRAARTFIICEQDIVPTTDQWRTLATCGHPWCFYDYDDQLYPDGPKFGLVRISRQVMLAHPQAAAVALMDHTAVGGLVPWWNVDSAMCRDLIIRLGRPAPEGDTPEARELATYPWKRAGAVCHTPAVRHLHDGPPSGQAA